MLVWVVAGVVGVIIFAIASIVIGRETFRLEHVAPKPTFDIDKATTWIGDNLPDEVTAQISYDDVRSILTWSLEFFKTKGVQANGVDRVISSPVVIGSAETVDWVMLRAAANGSTISPVEIHAVLDAQFKYLDVIGAVGPLANDPEATALAKRMPKN